MKQFELSTLDYMICLFCLIASLSIGVYIALLGRKQKSLLEYLLAGRTMSSLPSSLSLLVTIMSAITVMGVPASVFLHGTSYWMFAFSYFIFIPILAHFFVPVFYDLGISSVFEYLQKRFNRTAQLCGTVCYILMITTYMGVALYAPALAINTTTGISTWLSVSILSVVCCLYTALGGLKAVIWTDVFQALVVFASQIVVLIIGTIKIGGLTKVIDIAQKENKISPIVFDPSPFSLHTFWACGIGGTFLCLNIYGVNQAAAQRVLCCKTKKEAQTTVYLNFPLLQIFMALGCFLGLLLYAEYRCDNPMFSFSDMKPDQLLIYYVLHTLKEWHGLPGLFIGCLLSASLSSISSCLNSLTTVTIEDLIRPYHTLSDQKALIFSKVIVVVYTLLFVSMSIIASAAGSLLEAALGILGILGGPILGMFILGMFCRFVNSKGILVGFVASLIFSIFIGFGSTFYRMFYVIPSAPRQFLSESCVENISSNVTAKESYQFFNDAAVSNGNASQVETTNSPYSGVWIIFKLSYMWYSLSSVLVATVFAFIVSALTASENVHESTIVPLLRRNDYSSACQKESAEDELMALGNSGSSVI